MFFFSLPLSKVPLLAFIIWNGLSHTSQDNPTQVRIPKPSFSYIVRGGKHSINYISSKTNDNRFKQGSFTHNALILKLESKRLSRLFYSFLISMYFDLFFTNAFLMHFIYDNGLCSYKITYTSIHMFINHQMNELSDIRSSSAKYQNLSISHEIMAILGRGIINQGTFGTCEYHQCTFGTFHQYHHDTLDTCHKN